MCLRGSVTLTTPLGRVYRCLWMDASTITLEQIDRAHRQERAEEARRLAARLATAEEIQEENSLIPKTLPVRIPDLAEYARRHYAR